MKRSIQLAVIAVAMLVVGSITPASGITYGELAGDAHPEVVLIIMEIDDAPAYRCSGTLIAPTVVLTAGHCTGEGGMGGEFSGMRVFTESDVDAGTDITNSYPDAGDNSVEAAAFYTHPEYTSAAFFLHDVGVIVLEEAIILDDDAYGVLPDQDQLDALKAGRSKHRAGFTAVGYGLQQVNAAFAQADRVRMISHPELLQINTPGFTGNFSMLLSNNAHTGGTCFGDSGGPNFLEDTNVVAGVTSYGLNGSCGGTGGVFRMDQADVLDFVAPILAANS